MDEEKKYEFSGTDIQIMKLQEEIDELRNKIGFLEDVMNSFKDEFRYLKYDFDVHNH